MGDNLVVMSGMASSSVELVYADPPFGANRSRRGALGEFNDTWPRPADYIAWLRPRVQEMHRLLAPLGTLYLHLDRRNVHHGRLLLDEVFGEARFGNEIIWHYTGGGRSGRYFPHKHDNILVYHRGSEYTFNADAVREPYAQTSGYARSGIVSAAGKLYRPHPLGKVMDDVWRVPIVNPLSPERTGYPTQKPVELLRRIVAASSDCGDVVLDPFCGSGTTPVVAESLGRRWIAIDESPAAIETARARLERLRAGR